MHMFLRGVRPACSTYILDCSNIHTLLKMPSSCLALAGLGHNAPILRLPPELLSRIFHSCICRGPPRIHYRCHATTALRLTHVCRLWREAAQATRELWATIVFNHQPAAYREHALRLSGKALLDVWLVEWGRFRDAGLLTLVQDHGHRIRSLVLWKTSIATGAPQGIESHFTAPVCLPRLEALAVDYCMLSASERFWTPLLDARNLRSLRLGSGIADIATWHKLASCTRLRSLTIAADFHSGMVESGTVWPPLPEFLDILAGLTDLEELQVWVPRRTEWLPVERPTVLAKLTTLSFDGCPKNAAYLISQLVLPSLLHCKTSHNHGKMPPEEQELLFQAVVTYILPHFTQDDLLELGIHMFVWTLLSGRARRQVMGEEVDASFALYIPASDGALSRVCRTLRLDNVRRLRVEHANPVVGTELLEVIRPLTRVTDLDFVHPPPHELLLPSDGVLPFPGLERVSVEDPCTSMWLCSRHNRAWDEDAAYPGECSGPTNNCVEGFLETVLARQRSPRPVQHVALVGKWKPEIVHYLRLAAALRNISQVVGYSVARASLLCGEKEQKPPCRARF